MARVALMAKTKKKDHPLDRESQKITRVSLR